jgi:glycosyltransferase 2 family protein
MRKTLIRILRNPTCKLLFRIVVTICLLIFALRTVNIENLATAFSHADPIYLLYAVFLGIVANAIGGLAWRPLLSALGIKLGKREFIRTYLLGLFFALFTPGGLGSDAIRTYELKRMTGKGMFGFGSIITSRILSLFALLLLGLVMSVIFQPNLQSTKIVIGIFAVSVLLLLVSVSMILFWRHRRKNLKTSTNSLYTQIYDLVGAFMRKPGAVIFSTIMYVLHHLVVVLAICVGATAVDIDVPIKSMFALVPLARAAALLPISINGFGIQESVVLILMRQIGIPPEVAIIISLLGHLVLVPVPLFGGIVFLFTSFHKVRSQTTS